MSDRKREILYALERIGYFGQANPQPAAELAYTIELCAANAPHIAALNAAGITSVSADGAGAHSHERTRMIKIIS